MQNIANFLNKIKNAQVVSKKTVKFPFSKMIFQIAKILEKEKFIEEVEKKGKGPKKFIKIVLKYKENNLPAISGFKMISTPSRRIYKRAKEIKKVKGGLGIAIISTSKGLLTDKEARKENVGGEVICEIW